MNIIKSITAVTVLLALFVGVVFLSLDSQKYTQAPEPTEVEAYLTGSFVDSSCGGESGGLCKDLAVNLSTTDKEYSALLSHESVSWLKQYLKVENLNTTAQNLKVRFHPEKIAFKISEVNNQKIGEPAPWFYIKN